MVMFIKGYLLMDLGKINQEKLNINAKQARFIQGDGQKVFKMGKEN